MFVWLLLLSVYSWKKARLLFQRQSSINRQTRELKENILSPLRLEVEKHNRLLELIGTGHRSTESQIPFRFTSQSGEDIVLYDFFKGQAPGYFVEAGAYDGVTLSNTYLLESLGWKGLLVEPHPRMAELCRKRRPNSILHEVALGPDGAFGTVEFTCADDPNGHAYLSYVDASEEHIDNCLAQQCNLKEILVNLVSLNSLLDSQTESVDLLSLDVEGMELSVLKGFDLSKFQPRVILVEMQRNDGDALVEQFLAGFGYESAGIVGCNCFFAPRPHVERLTRIISCLFG